MPAHSEQEMLYRFSERRSGWFWIGLTFAAAAVVAAWLGSAEIKVFIRGWFIGWMLWIPVTIGSLGLAMLRHTVRARWGLPLLRLFEAASGWQAFLVLIVAFVPVAIRLPDVFAWTAPGKSTWYLNLPFFYIRLVVYFGIWLVYSIALRRSSTALDPTQEERRENWRANVSAPGIVVLFLTSTFACYDWLMSLQPDWTSTIYGLIFVITSALCAMSYALAFLKGVSKEHPYRELTAPDMTRDFGNLLLTILLLWAYFNYSQYIVVWSGDIVKEIRYFTDRSGYWDAIAVALIVLGFFGPLLALTSPRVKASMKLVGNLARWMLVIGWLDFFWMAAPKLVDGQPWSLWGVAFLSFAAIGSFWRWAYLVTLSQAPLVPQFETWERRSVEHVAT